MRVHCKTCGCHAVEEVTAGHRIADVVGVTLDDGLVCDLVTFVPSEDSISAYYRCKQCHAILPFTKSELVEFLRGI